jgi:hypothetical protein
MDKNEKEGKKRKVKTIEGNKYKEEEEGNKIEHAQDLQRSFTESPHTPCINQMDTFAYISSFNHET